MLKLRKFLNNTPAEFIRRFLESFTRHGWDDIDWNEQRPRVRATSIQAAIENSTDKVQEKVVATIDLIEQLADEAGRRALRDVLGPDDDIAAFDALPDARACAVEVLLISEAVFDRALSIHYADRHRSGRSWSGYFIDADDPGSPSDDETQRIAFKGAVASIMSEVAGKGLVDVEWFDRWLEDPDSGDRRVCVQATFYHEGPPRSEPTFNLDAEITHRPTRPAIEGALIYDEAERSVSVVANGGRNVREQIADAFMSTMLRLDAELQVIMPWSLDFSPLMSRPTFEVRPEDAIESVEVAMLRFVSPSSHPLFFVVETGADAVIDEGDIYERLRRHFGPSAPFDRPGWRIVAADLRVELLPPPGKSRNKRLKVELRAPNRTNLRDQTEAHRKLGHELLERWGLYAKRE